MIGRYWPRLPVWHSNLSWLRSVNQPQSWYCHCSPHSHWRDSSHSSSHSDWLKEKKLKIQNIFFSKARLPLTLRISFFFLGTRNKYFNYRLLQLLFIFFKFPIPLDQHLCWSQCISPNLKYTNLLLLSQCLFWENCLLL